MILQASMDLMMLTPIFFLIILLSLGGFVLFVAALVTFLNTENMGDDRVVWAIIIVFTGPIGGILWFIIGRPKFRKISQIQQY